MATIYNNLNSSSGYGSIRPAGGTSICNISSGTALVKTGNGFIRGITVNSSVAFIADIYDGTSVTGNLMHSSLSFSAGTNNDMQGEMFTTGLFVNVTSGIATIRFN